MAPYETADAESWSRLPERPWWEEYHDLVWEESAAERIEWEESRFWRFGDWAEPVKR